MSMTKAMYEWEMNRFGLKNYDELSAYRWEYSKKYEDFINSLSLLATQEEIDAHRLKCTILYQDYSILVDMMVYGLKNNLFKSTY